MDEDIDYHFDSPLEFHAELTDLLSTPTSTPTIPFKTYLSLLTAHNQTFLPTLSLFVSEIYNLLDSPLWTRHSSVLLPFTVQLAATTSNPAHLYVLYHILLSVGHEDPRVFRQLWTARCRWASFFEKLLNEVATNPPLSTVNPCTVNLAFEMCRLSRLSSKNLALFTKSFINQILDSIENTRDDRDESYNYALISLLLALNEQYMLAASTSRSTPPPADPNDPFRDSDSDSSAEPPENLVILLLEQRGGSASATLGENLIFMLNRVTSTDPGVSLLILKFLYLLLTTPKTADFFYLNDLRVLLDVFLRELGNLGNADGDISLRHTFLRVLTPLMANTPLSLDARKKSAVRSVLRSVLAQARWGTVDQTTLRLTERCLRDGLGDDTIEEQASSSSTTTTIVVAAAAAAAAAVAAVVTGPTTGPNTSTGIEDGGVVLCA